MGFTDIHSHFVYGVDDGAKTAQDMYAMLDAAWADGITTLYATPHVTPGVKPFDQETFDAHLEAGRQYCRSKGYTMKLCAGAELLFTPAMAVHIPDHRLPMLEGTERVLMEFVPTISFRELHDALALLERCGYSAILAHIERYDCLYQGNAAKKLKERFDVHFQVNANTLLAERGFLRAMKIRQWFKQGLIDRIASDAHDLVRRPFRMQDGYKKLEQMYGKDLAEKLTGARHRRTQQTTDH